MSRLVAGLVFGGVGFVMLAMVITVVGWDLDSEGPGGSPG
jgi:hypothetical protein